MESWQFYKILHLHVVFILENIAPDLCTGSSWVISPLKNPLCPPDGRLGGPRRYSEEWDFTFGFSSPYCSTAVIYSEITWVFELCGYSRKLFSRSWCEHAFGNHYEPQYSLALILKLLWSEIVMCNFLIPQFQLWHILVGAHLNFTKCR
jgi:hypothetical protein